MRVFDPNTGMTVFGLGASPYEPVFLVGDFNLWQMSELAMDFERDKWRFPLRFPSGSYQYAFQF